MGNLKTDELWESAWTVRNNSSKLFFVISSWWCPTHTVEVLVCFGFKSMTWKLSETFSGYINMEQFISAQSGPAKTFRQNCKPVSLLIKQFVELILLLISNVISHEICWKPVNEEMWETQSKWLKKRRRTKLNWVFLHIGVNCVIVSLIQKRSS